MNYGIIITRHAEREIRKLPASGGDRVEKAIELLAETTRPIGCYKLKGSKDEYRIRSGRFRIIYRIDDRLKQVYIHSVGDRKDVYRQRP
jgi:mRNA interferase RelE/StbE